LSKSKKDGQDNPSLIKKNRKRGEKGVFPLSKKKVEKNIAKKKGGREGVKWKMSGKIQKCEMTQSKMRRRLVGAGKLKEKRFSKRRNLKGS